MLVKFYEVEPQVFELNELFCHFFLVFQIHYILVNPNWILSDTYTGNDNVSLTIQPFITYTFKTGTAISMSPLMNGNFIADAWLVPVGLGVSQLLKLGIPMNISVQGFYNAVKPTPDYGDWSLR